MALVVKVTTRRQREQAAPPLVIGTKHTPPYTPPPPQVELRRAAEQQQQSPSHMRPSPPEGGAWIANRISKTGVSAWKGGTDLAARGSPPHSHVLAFQPECNPPAHTTVASRTRLQLQTLLPAPPVQDGGQLDNTVGARAGEHDGADPAELDAHSERFSPPPLYKTEDGLTTLRASPPAKRLLARVTRCGQPRIGTRPTNCIPHPLR